MTAPADASTVSGAAVTVSASTTGPVVGVQFKLDGVNLGAEDIGAPYSITWSTVGVAAGVHSLSAVARRADGVTATATAVSATVAQGGGVILIGETDGLGIDYLHAVAGERVAKKSGGVITYSNLQAFYTNAATASPKLTFDVNGNFVWSPHNFFLNSATPATQSVTTIVGYQYTVTVVGSGSMTGSAGASGVATAGAPLTYTATTTTSTFTLAGSLSQIQMNRGTVATEYLATTAAMRIGVAVDYHPTTHAPLGMLGEAAVTPLLLNNATLATQSATVTAVAHTLSFWGTGTVTLSGTSTAGPLVGTGAANRVSLTFTPTAGSLTLTVTGTVTNAQLEIGTVPTSFVPVFGVAVTRAVDDIRVTPVSSFGWSAAGANSVVMWAAPNLLNTVYMALHDNTDNERHLFDTSAGTKVARVVVTDATVSQADLSPAAGVPVVGTLYKVAAALAAGDFAASINGAAVLTDAAGTLPTVTIMSVCGGRTGGRNVYFRKHKIVPRRMTNAELVTEAT
jgi:hypothetical protein